MEPPQEEDDFDFKIQHAFLSCIFLCIIILLVFFEPKYVTPVLTVIVVILETMAFVFIFK